jgi:putative glutamine amidotransferase
MSSSRPRIGITGAQRTPRERARLQACVEAVEAAGGEPVLLLPGASDNTDRTLDGVDGLLLTGGEDVDPQHFGEQAREGWDVEVDPARDALELSLVRAAIQRDLPVLGICRGIQVLNVAMGGTLIQDIDRELTGRQSWSHQQQKSHPAAPSDAAIHEVEIAPGSRLREIVGADRLGVNTFHHQAIAIPAPGLAVTARAVERESPGVIEAVESARHRFVLGVQWHPERMWRRDAASARLFAAVVDAARSTLRRPSAPR